MDKLFIHSKKPLKERRRELRKNMTPEEKILWKHLRKKFLGARFQRQHSIGPYITDFYCAKKRLVIEIDGSQHSKPESKLYDSDRTGYIEAQNIHVLRFSNQEVSKNIQIVITKIEKILAVLPSLKIKGRVGDGL